MFLGRFRGAYIPSFLSHKANARNIQCKRGPGGSLPVESPAAGSRLSSTAHHETHHEGFVLSDIADQESLLSEKAEYVKVLRFKGQQTSSALRQSAVSREEHSSWKNVPGHSRTPRSDCGEWALLVQEAEQPRRLQSVLH